MSPVGASAVDAAVFESDLVTVGIFAAPPDHPRFAVLGRIPRPSFVFPRTSVFILNLGAPPIVADPSAVMFYNRRQRYRRAPISPRGDRCDWFRIREDALVRIIADWDPSVAERPQRPFPFSWGPTDAAVYLAQRQVVEHLSRHTRPDTLFVEDAVLEVFCRAVARAFAATGRAPLPLGARARRARAELADAARRVLAESYAEPLTLTLLSDRIGTSPHHLSRVFKKHTGTTIHAHLNQLRLRASLEHLADPRAELTDVALALGYSSHSHFTHAFRKAFGVPPSRVRERLSQAGLRALRSVDLGHVPPGRP